MTRHLAMIRLLVTSAGNEFMLDIARAFHAGFRQLGQPSELLVDEVPGPSVSGSIDLVIAPHEYFPLFLLNQVSAQTAEQLIRSVYVVNVEQPGSPWFDHTLEFARPSLGVFDISSSGTHALRRHGLPAVHAPLGVPADLSSIDRSRTSTRDTDILFIGTSSDRRERFFAKHAAAFARWRCELLFLDVSSPRRSDTPGYCTDDGRSTVLARSKILLNVHAFDSDYFETHRALLALSHGCCLVSETSTGVEPLVNGMHFAMSDLDELPDTCAQLLVDHQRLDVLAERGLALARNELTPSAGCQAIIDRVVNESDTSPAALLDTRRQAVRERLAASLATRTSAGADWQAHANRLHSISTDPAVSVIITVRDYEHFLLECVTSVLASHPVPGGMELVIVDDGSSDGSARLARQLIDSAQIPACAIAKARNTGLADSRNVGLGAARGTFVLTLDADNWLLPTCIVELVSALQSGRYAAAYPIVRRLGHPSGRPLGLLSLYPWSVRDLVRSPYIDALALFRRDVLVALGGYAIDLIDYGWFGWEDYDLWLRLADEGYECVRVPTVLASYRVHGSSMIGDTNLTSSALADHFSERFAALVARYPDLDSYFGFPAPASDPQPSGDEALLHHCAELERRLAEFHLSWSWKITAPLRAAYRAVTGSR